MKMKDALTKIGEEVVYAVPNSRWTLPEIVTLIGVAEPGTVSVTAHAAARMRRLTG